MRRSRTGFTLIELLVVIAIIAILAAILFPVFARARENARKASCASNLKQIATASRMYQQDYDGKVVPMWTWGVGEPGNPPGRLWWQWIIQPYVRNFQAIECPSASSTWFHRGVATGAPEAGCFRGSTGIGKQWFRRDGWQGTDGGHWNDFISEAAIQYPSETIEYCDSDCVVAGPWTPNDVPNYGVSSWPGGYKRHSDGANYAFLDGHVKWMKDTGVPPQYWDPLR